MGFNHRFAASHGMTVGKTFVAETLKRNAYAIAALRRQWKRNLPAPLPPNAVWGLDLTAVRPHQHLQGRTPLDAWRGIDPFKQVPKSVTLFEAWEGLLTGYYIRR